MPTTLNGIVERPVSWVYRSAQVQFRNAATARFTGTWVDISQYVKKWGSLELAIDDVRFNNFTDKGINVTVNNDTGAFNHHSNVSSLWFGYMKRYRTLLRIQGAYYETDLSTTIPADPTLGIFVLDQEIGVQSGSNDVYLRASSLKSVFDEVQATDIGGLLNTTMTADAIVGKIRDYTDGTGVYVLREFITSTAWSITAAPNNYFITTDMAAGMSGWEIMDKLAESEGFVLMINRTGGIEFRPRSARQGTSQFAFTGQNFPRPNVIAITNYREAVDKHYNIYRLKYLPAATSTSYVTAGTSTAVNNTNPSWVDGARIYDFENQFPQDTATAQAVVNNLFSLSSNGVPTDIDVETTFVPGLDVLDAVDLSHRSYNLANNALWDVMVWDTDKWGQEGVNFDLNSTSCFLTAVRIDLDALKNTFTMRQE